MGTSLSGLTPATTFDGLLKVGDNDPLTADLKAISTGDGTDTILSLSNSALQVNGEATIVGLTNNTSASAILAQNSDAYNLLQVRNDGTTIINNGAYSFSQPRFTSTKEIVIHQGLSVGQTAAPTAARAHIKGSGATSATTSLLVQNSAGATAFQVDDGGNIGLGNAPLTGIKVAQTSGAARFRDLYFGNIGSSAINNGSLTSINWNGSTGIGIANSEALAATAMLHVKGSGNDNTTTSLLVQNSDGAELFKVDDSGIGFYVNGDEDSKLRLYALGQNALIQGGRNLRIESGGGNALNITGSGINGVIIGTTVTNIAANTSLAVRGKGATSATTALLVQNSAGADMLKVSDNGNVLVNQYIYPADGTTNSSFRLSNGNGTQMAYAQGIVIVNPSFRYFTSYLNKIAFEVAATTGDVSINGATGAKVGIKGNGATSATTALLVQNSAGTDLLKVLDDGSVFSNGGGAKLASNTGFGEGVLGSITTGTNHTAFGLGALKDVTTGVSNTAMGWWSGYNTTLGSNNAFFGTMSAYTNTSGANNTGIGTRALYNNGTANDNTAVGYLADSAGFSGNVILGRGATATAGNQFVVGSSTTNAGAVDVVGDPTPTHTWEVVINGVKYRILLQEVV